jgi:hypothetical protein
MRDRLCLMGLACATLLAAMIAGFVLTTNHNGSRVGSSEPQVVGASSLARPHPPLDRAPGEPLEASPREVTPQIH